MNTGRSFATATVISSGPNAGKVLIAGGASNGPSYLNTTIYTPSTELYDPLTNSFAPPGQTAVMNAGRGEAAAITIATGPDAGKIPSQEVWILAFLTMFCRPLSSTIP